MQIVLFELTAGIDSEGNEQTFYYSTGSGYSGVGVTAYYDPRITGDLPVYSLKIADDLQTFGEGQVGRGEVSLANPDGALDHLNNYGYGRPARMIVGDDTLNFSTFEVYQTGIVEQVTYPDSATVSCRFRDSQRSLDLPFQPAKFAGTNNDTTIFIEGTANIAGTTKPRFGGKVRNITPILTDPGILLYCFNFDTEGETAPCIAINAARDGGVTLTPGVDHPTLAALIAAAQGGTITNDYDTCLAASALCLDAEAEYGLTIDAQAQVSLCGEVLEAVLSEGGVTQIGTASFAQFRMDANYTVGYYVTKESSFREVANLVADAGGGFFFPDRLDVYQAKQFKDPAPFPYVVRFKRFDGSTSAASTDADIISIKRFSTNDPGRGIPVERCIMKHTRNYTPQTAAELNTLATAEEQDEFGQEWLTDYQPVNPDTPGRLAILAQYPLAGQIEFESAITDPAHAVIENSRRYTLYGARRDMFEVEAVLTAPLARMVELGSIVNVQSNRFGLDDGKNFFVTQIELSSVTDEESGDKFSTMKLVLWG